MPNLVRRCYAYAEFGEIQSGYDTRAVDNTLASQGLEIYARATPESDFAKIVHPEGLGPRLIFDRIDRGVARAPMSCSLVTMDIQWRGRRSHVDSVEKSAHAQHLRTL